MKIDPELVNTIQCADALSLLKTLPNDSVHCVITSPPYANGVRDYHTDAVLWPEVIYAPMPGLPEIWIPAWKGELGQEDDPAAYVGHLLLILREVKRVLRPDGNFFLNLGDSYSSGGRGSEKAHRRKLGAKQSAAQGTGRKIAPSAYSDKALLLIPHRVAMALQADGWILRQDNVWNKPNAMPASVTDRTTRSHEYVFHFVKSKRYFYDAEAVKEKAINNNGGDFSKKFIAAQPAHGGVSNFRRKQNTSENRTYVGFNERWSEKTTNISSRNKRSVWDINTEPSIIPHYAMMPQKLVATCLLLGSPKQICAICGASYKRMIEKVEVNKSNEIGIKQMIANGVSRTTANLADIKVRGGSRTLGFEPTCVCDHAETSRALVLDPFCGAGTVAVVAQSCGRDYLGIEIDPKSADWARHQLGLPVENPNIYLDNQKSDDAQLAVF